MPLGQLRNQQSEDDLRAARFLEAHVVALVSTANVCITLATALAGGIALLGHTASGESLRNFDVFLLLAAAATIASLVAGLVVYVGHAGVYRGAMGIHSVRREGLVSVLASEGEATLQARYLEAIPQIAQDVAAARRDYEKRVDVVQNAVAAQAGLLVGAVFLALIAAGSAYMQHAL